MFTILLSNSLKVAIKAKDQYGPVLKEPGHNPLRPKESKWISVLSILDVSDTSQPGAIVASEKVKPKLVKILCDKYF